MRTTFPIFSVAILLVLIIPTNLLARRVDLPSKTYNRRCEDIGGDPQSHVDMENSKNVIKSEKGFKYEHNYKIKKGGPLEIAAGSRLPDCSHACGSCTPCRLAVVGFVCSTLAQSEPCPISYRCLCNGKSYPVP